MRILLYFFFLLECRDFDARARLLVRALMAVSATTLANTRMPLFIEQPTFALNDAIQVYSSIAPNAYAKRAWPTIDAEYKIKGSTRSAGRSRLAGATFNDDASFYFTGRRSARYTPFSLDAAEFEKMAWASLKYAQARRALLMRYGIGLLATNGTIRRSAYRPLDDVRENSLGAKAYAPCAHHRPASVASTRFSEVDIDISLLSRQTEHDCRWLAGLYAALILRRRRLHTSRFTDALFRALRS